MARFLALINGFRLVKTFRNSPVSTIRRSIVLKEMCRRSSNSRCKSQQEVRGCARTTRSTAVSTFAVVLRGLPLPCRRAADPVAVNFRNIFRIASLLRPTSLAILLYEWPHRMRARICPISISLSCLVIICQACWFCGIFERRAV